MYESFEHKNTRVSFAEVLSSLRHYKAEHTQTARTRTCAGIFVLVYPTPCRRPRDLNNSGASIHRNSNARGKGDVH